MVHTVGLVGANGRVGGATAKKLVSAASEGQIKLVLFHREGSPLKDFQSSSNVELRVIDLNGPPSALEKAVSGINVFIACLGIEALPSEPKLVDALATSKDLVTYIPSTFSAPWTAEDEADEAFGPLIKFMHGGLDRAREQGLGITTVLVGGFDDYVFEYGFNGSPIKGNTVWANQKQLKNKFPITLIAHLGPGIADVACSDPQSIRNKSFSFVTYWPTGQDLVDLYTKLNGSQATVKDYTASDRDTMRADAENMGPIKAAYWDHWELEDWGYEDDGAVLDKSFQGPGLEETARRYV